MSGVKIAALVLLLAAAVAAGWWGRDLSVADGSPAASAEKAPSVSGGEDAPCPGGEQPLYWKAPMDPTYIRDEPGKSPMGMNLVPECPAAGGQRDPGVVEIDATTVQNIGVRTVPVERRALSRAVRAVGGPRVFARRRRARPSLCARRVAVRSAARRRPGGRRRGVVEAGEDDVQPAPVAHDLPPPHTNEDRASEDHGVVRHTPVKTNAR